MLRRAFKLERLQHSADQENHVDVVDKQKTQKLHLVELGNGRKRKPTTWHRGLEEMVFADSDDIIDLDVTGDELLQNKSQRRNHVVRSANFENELKSAWEDEYEKTYNPHCAQTPQWARLDRQSEKDEIGDDSDVLPKSTGNYLVKSTSLPASVLQVKKLADVHADDDREGVLHNVEFHPAAKVILTAGTTHRINLFQVNGRNNPKIQSIFLEDFAVRTAHFSSDGNEIIVGSDRKNFMFYDMNAGRAVTVPKIKGLEGCSMAKFELSPDGRYIAFLGKHGSLHLLSAQTKELITTLRMNGDVHCVCFTKDGSKMFSFGSIGTVFVWDMNTRNCVHTFLDEGCLNGTAVAVSPSDQYIACGSQSGIVNIYQQELCQLETHPKPLKSVMNLTTKCNKTKFNFSSEMLATASYESIKAIKLIHLPSMNVFANFPEMMDRQLQIPTCVDFSPNGGYMAIGNQKGQALLYRLSHYSNF